MKDNVSIARSFYDRWNNRDFDGVAALFAPDGELVEVGAGLRLIGPEGAKELARMWADAFPDGSVTVERTFAAGDCVCLEMTGRGTHTGTLRSPGGDIPATGRPVELEGCDVIEVRDGKIASMRSYMDSGTMLAQLGLLPEPQVAAHA